MPTGYCTTDDVRRALREADLPGDAVQDPAIVTDAIAAQTEWLEKMLKRHWYEPTGIDGADHIDIPTSTKTRDDEEDIPTSSAVVVGEASVPKTSQGDYAKIELGRRDAVSISQLLVRTSDGSFEDWVESNDYTGGTWPDAVGDDYYLRVNNGGWSRLYIDTTNLLVDGEDDEYVLDSFANAVYITWEYGHEGLPKSVRRAAAFRAASDLTDEAAIQIPDNTRLRSVDTLAEEFREKADELLEAYR